MFRTQTNVLSRGGRIADYLLYFDRDRRTSWRFELFRTNLEDGRRFHVDIIDTWNMTVTPVDQVFTVKRRDAYMFEDVEGRSVTLPGRPFMALRITRIP